MNRFILLLSLMVMMIFAHSCAFFAPMPPQTPVEVQTVVMWCDVENDYTEWEVHKNYFQCTVSSTIWY